LFYALILIFAAAARVAYGLRDYSLDWRLRLARLLLRRVRRSREGFLLAMRRDVCPATTSRQASRFARLAGFACMRDYVGATRNSRGGVFPAHRIPLCSLILILRFFRCY